MSGLAVQPLPPLPHIPHAPAISQPDPYLERIHMAAAVLFGLGMLIGLSAMVLHLSARKTAINALAQRISLLAGLTSGVCLVTSAGLVLYRCCQPARQSQPPIQQRAQQPHPPHVNPVQSGALPQVDLPLPGEQARPGGQLHLIGMVFHNPSTNGAARAPEGPPASPTPQPPKPETPLEKFATLFAGPELTDEQLRQATRDILSNSISVKHHGLSSQLPSVATGAQIARLVRVYRSDRDWSAPALREGIFMGLHEAAQRTKKAEALLNKEEVCTIIRTLFATSRSEHEALALEHILQLDWRREPDAMTAAREGYRERPALVAKSASQETPNLALLFMAMIDGKETIGGSEPDELERLFSSPDPLPSAAIAPLIEARITSRLITRAAQRHMLTTLIQRSATTQKTADHLANALLSLFASEETRSTAVAAILNLTAEQAALVRRSLLLATSTCSNPNQADKVMLEAIVNGVFSTIKTKEEADQLLASLDGWQTRNLVKPYAQTGLSASPYGKVATSLAKPGSSSASASSPPSRPTSTGSHPLQTILSNWSKGAITVDETMKALTVWQGAVTPEQIVELCLPAQPHSAPDATPENSLPIFGLLISKLSEVDQAACAALLVTRMRATETPRSPLGLVPPQGIGPFRLALASNMAMWETSHGEDPQLGEVMKNLVNTATEEAELFAFDMAIHHPRGSPNARKAVRAAYRTYRKGDLPSLRPSSRQMSIFYGALINAQDADKTAIAAVRNPSGRINAAQATTLLHATLKHAISTVARGALISQIVDHLMQDENTYNQFADHLIASAAQDPSFSPLLCATLNRQPPTTAIICLRAALIVGINREMTRRNPAKPPDQILADNIAQELISGLFHQLTPQDNLQIVTDFQREWGPTTPLGRAAKDGYDASKLAASHRRNGSSPAPLSPKSLG